MEKPVFVPDEILLPAHDIDKGRWAVLACDQFTSEPEYWADAEAAVGKAPSTLRIILPEVYLEEEGTEARIADIHTAMARYRDELLNERIHGFVYVERDISTGTRQGLVGCVDLDAYSYEKGAEARIRPSENTVVERIPPRLAVRRGAALESPHILMLVDDEACAVIEPLGEKKDNLPLLYDEELMLGGGRVRGWAVTSEADIATITAALAALEDEAAFAARYGASTAPFPLAVGDGNHSLATAKALWEEIKPGLSPEERLRHPARLCLVELENIQSPAIDIEPIHRVVFGLSDEEFMRACEGYCGENGVAPSRDGNGEQSFTLLCGDKRTELSLQGARQALTVGSVEAILAYAQKTAPAMRVDYVHGEDSVAGLVAQGALGLLLPPLEKADLFRGVALGGVLPKKTFSMGHAVEKRYYMECRKIL